MAALLLTFARLTVALQRLPFTIHARQFRAGGGKLRGGLVARAGQIVLARTGGLQGLAQFGQSRCRAIRGLSRGSEVFLGIAFPQQGCTLLFQPPGLGFQPIDARLGLCDLGLSHPPFGFHARMVRRGLGECEFGLAPGAFGLFHRIGMFGSSGLVRQQLLRALVQRGFQILQGRGGIARHAIGVDPVFFQSRLLTVQIHEPIFRRFQLAGECCHAMPVRAGIVAAVCQFVAQSMQAFGQGSLRLLRLFRGFLRGSYPVFRALCLRARGFGSGGGVAPAGKDQPRFGHADLVGQQLVALGLLRLPAQRPDLRIEARHQVFQAFEVLLGGTQLALGIAAAHVQAGDARGFLQHHAPLGRLGGNDLRDLALAYESRGVCARRGIGEDERYVLRPYIVTVQAIGAAGAAFDAARHVQRLALVVHRVEDDLGKVAGRAVGGAGEDHVFHSARSHGFGRVLAHYPPNGFQHVGLAAAIGANDARKAGFDTQFGGFDEALEAAQAKLAKLHGRPPSASAFGRPRACILQNGFQIVPAALIQNAAVEDEGGSGIDAQFGGLRIGTLTDGEHLFAVGQAGAGLVPAHPSCGEEIQETGSFRDGDEALVFGQVADIGKLRLRTLHLTHHIVEVRPHLIRQRVKALRRGAPRERGEGEVEHVVNLVAQFKGDHAGGHIVFDQLIRACLREIRAGAAGERTVFDQLERSIGVAQQVSVRLGHFHHLGP